MVILWTSINQHNCNAVIYCFSQINSDFVCVWLYGENVNILLQRFRYKIGLLRTLLCYHKWVGQTRFKTEFWIDLLTLFDKSIMSVYTNEDRFSMTAERYLGMPYVVIYFVIKISKYTIFCQIFIVPQVTEYWQFHDTLIYCIFS